MTELKLTGGARIGFANASFPFATLRVSKHKLELKASLIGNLVFQPADIVSIEPYRLIPVIGQGILIKHNVPTYKERVIFWTTANPESVVQQIRSTGFLADTTNPSSTGNLEIVAQQRKSGFPLKLWYTIAMIAVWNSLFMVDVLPHLMGEKTGLLFGKGITTALIIVFLTSLLSLLSSGFRRLILKDGFGRDDIKQTALLMMLISGLMLLAIAVGTH